MYYQRNRKGISVITLGTRRKLLAFSRTLLLASVLFYFSYHIVSGEKGVLAMIQLEQKVLAAKEELAVVEAQKEHLEKRVNFMYARSLDPDLLDEQARKNLGRASSDEIVYMVPGSAEAIR